MAVGSSSSSRVPERQMRREDGDFKVQMGDKGRDLRPCRSSGTGPEQAGEAHSPEAGCNTSLSSWKHAQSKLAMLCSHAI